ncbi:MAG: FecR domain-containing protein [Opitutaceae bacterium]|nr:FecR domain-containing protein [Opitutaceae bacterium]
MTPRPFPSSDDAHAIERAAAEWTLQLRAGLNDDQQQEFIEWLQRDDRHPAVFAEMDKTSRLLDQLRESPPLATNVIPFETSAIPEPVSQSRRRGGVIALSIAAACLMIAGGIFSLRPDRAPQNYTASLATEIGATRTMQMPDGSVLRLNTDSLVEVAYTAAERRVNLKRGEAFFSVAKNPQRPFWVDVGAVSVRAVGTAFNVRYRPSSVEVLVKEGKVSLKQAVAAKAAPTNTAAEEKSDPVSAHLLVAGEQATVSLPANDTREAPIVRVATLPAERLESTLAWQEGRLEFSDTPLADVVTEFNRYNRSQIVIGDASLGAELFGGSFAPHGYDAFIEVLEQSFGIVAERQGDEILLRRNPIAAR